MLDIEAGLGGVGERSGIGPLSGLRLPLPLGGADFGHLHGERHRGGFLGFQSDGLGPHLAFGFAVVRIQAGHDEDAVFGDEVGAVIEREADCDFARLWCRVVNDGLHQQFVIKPGKTG